MESTFKKHLCFYIQLQQENIWKRHLKNLHIIISFMRKHHSGYTEGLET